MLFRNLFLRLNVNGSSSIHNRENTAQRRIWNLRLSRIYRLKTYTLVLLDNRIACTHSLLYVENFFQKSFNVLPDPTTGSSS